MANPSPFLQYQDKNGDFLIDECEIDLPGPLEKVCLDCKPNPKAIVENWKNNLGFPIFNEKLCLYQVGVKTPHTDTGGDDGIIDRFETYKEDAIELFLDEYQKAVSYENIQALREGITYDSEKDFDLEARANSRLSLLYSVPFDVMQNLEPDDGEDEEEDEDTEPVEVTYLASELPILLTRVRKGLNLYSRYVKYESVMQGASLLYEQSRSPFSIDKYGDLGRANNSELATAFIELDRFLNKRGFNIVGAGSFGFGKDRVVKITMGFSRKYKLKKLEVYSIGCREKPRKFKGRKIAALNRVQVFKDPTAMAYFSRLAEMERDLTARTPKNFTTFIEEHTYPKVSFFNNQELAEGDGSCVAEKIRDSIQGLGQDLLDEALSIGDIIAYKFHENICRTNEEESELLQQFGNLYKPASELVPSEGKKKLKKALGKKKGVLSKGSRQAMKAVAMQQALEKLETNQNIFVKMCGQILYGGGLTPETRDLWDFNFNQLKLCGLLDFLLDALGCLWGGLELEEALLIAVTSALKAMGLENFGALFAGLPPEEQAELDQLVKRKLAEAKQKRNTTQTAAQDEERDSVDPDASPFPWQNIQFKKPFEDPELLAQEQAARTAGPYEGTTVSKGMYEAESQNYGIRPRIGTTYTSGDEIAGQQSAGADAIKSLDKRSKQTFSPDQIMEAYIAALVEFYSGRLLDLVDKLNEFPGAEIISKVLALFDCPRPPLFTPSIMDFIKDIELPFCRNIGDITLPMLFIPPFSLADLWKRLLQAIIEAIIETVINILLKLFVKICEILGEAICKALETAGNIIGSLPSLLTGNTTFRDIVRDSICGENASSQDVDDSIAAMFANLGGAGANLANKDRVLQFNDAIASSSTRQEIIDAFLGDPSTQFLNSVDTIIDYEFPEFRDAFPNQQAIASFYSNCGNFLDPELKAQLDDIANQTYESLGLPANPTLCATPDQIEEFCAIRSQILEGRASEAQIAQLCERPTDDFQALNDILQDGIPATIMNNLPPLLSEPGCDNGLFPHETEDMQQDMTEALSADLENLKIAYSYDMLGNGFGQNNWGYLNLILSDTMGKPFTNHIRNVNRFSILGGKKYVDFYVTGSNKSDDDAINYRDFEKQRGAFPLYVGEWHRKYWQNSTDAVIVRPPSNDIAPERVTIIDEETRTTDITTLPNYGYNYKIEPLESGEGYRRIKGRRKRTPEVVLNFRDNLDGAGEESYTDDDMALGYRLQMFFGEINGGTSIKDSNARVRIFTRINAKNYAEAYKGFGQIFTGEPEETDDAYKNTKKNSQVTEDQLFEFVGIDGGVEDLLQEVKRLSGERNEFANFESSLEQVPSVPPMVTLLSDLIGVSDATATSYWQSTIQKLMDNFGQRIYGSTENPNSNIRSFLFGANPDTISGEAAQYGVVYGRGGNKRFVPYDEATIDGTENTDFLTSEDGVLGMSKDQFDNEEAGTPENTRIFYLDPLKFGGSYTRPKVYVKPVDNEGILGLVNVMFPEISPCKPQRTDLVDFSDIGDRMAGMYNSYPDDPRLIGDPDCIVERPFDRVLDRTAKAGIDGVISAACRIYCSIHFLQSINTFCAFKPDFKNNLSTLYASYIVENMERGMKDSQAIELLNPFKDDEYWYAFLEQAVQTYYQRIQSGQIVDVPSEIEGALERIAAAQNRYKYPSKKDLKEAKKIGEVRRIRGLNQYREDKNLEAVKSVEDDCKIILKEFVVEEMNFISNIFYQNMLREKLIDKNDYTYNLYYHILTELTDGANLTLNQELREQVSAPITEPEQSAYTNGDEFALEDGTPYIGYYHTMLDDEDDLVYMVGETHGDDDRLLRPFANKVTVNVGEVLTSGSTTGKPFYIEKYIKVDGVKYYKSDIETQIRALREEGDVLVSETHPGNLRPIYEGQKTRPGQIALGQQQGRVVGLQGELGVRHGLAFYAVAEGNQYKLIADAEIDVLDLPLAILNGLENNSKELLCLINKIVDDPRFKLFFEYAVPANKILASLAIYNDLTYLQGIGQITQGRKNSGTIKPGVKIDGTLSAEGWFPKEERLGFDPFTVTWDEWNREVLTKSNRVLKKMFKSHYYSREFGKQEGPDKSGFQVLVSNLKEKFKFAPGDRAVPWWYRRASNPFDAKGRMCETPDED